ncbi:MAG TPA: hypothetical protein VI248_09875 [Kineosporiaceae bacterium]
MTTDAVSSAGPARSGREAGTDRLGRRDLLVLRLELERRRRAAASAAQRATRSTR